LAASVRVTPTMACRLMALVNWSTGKSRGMANMAPNVALPLVRCAIPLVKVKTTLNPVAPNMSPIKNKAVLYTGLPKNTMNRAQVAILNNIMYATLNNILAIMVCLALAMVW